MAEPRRLLAFHVTATPRPKGSLTGHSPKGSTRVRMVESVDPEGVFRTAVAREACLAYYGILPEVTSYRHVLEFLARAGIPVPARRIPTQPLELRMRTTHPRKPGHEHWAPCEGEPHLAVGDTEKLVRNINDALQDAGVIGDDAHFTTLGRVGKRFIDEDMFEEPGVDVELWEDLEHIALARDAEVFG